MPYAGTAQLGRYGIFYPVIRNSFQPYNMLSKCSILALHSCILLAALVVGIEYNISLNESK